MQHPITGKLKRIFNKKTNLNLLITVCCFIFLSISSLFSQGAINLNSIEESRYIDSRKNLLTVKMQAKDFKADGYHFLKIKKIGKVFDDTGKAIQPYSKRTHTNN